MIFLNLVPYQITTSTKTGPKISSKQKKRSSTLTLRPWEPFQFLLNLPLFGSPLNIHSRRHDFSLIRSNTIFSSYYCLIHVGITTRPSTHDLSRFCAFKPTTYKCFSSSKLVRPHPYRLPLTPTR